MPKSTTWCNDLLKGTLQAVPIANMFDNAVSAPLTNLYVALCESDPGIGGSQLTGEVGYTGYARVAVARTAGGWAVTGAVGDNVGQIQFGKCTALPTTATHITIGTASSGAGKVLYAGELDDPQGIPLNVIPIIEAGLLDVVEA